MAEETSATTAGAAKATAKRKANARKAAATGTTAKKTTARKTAAKRRTAPRKAAASRASARKASSPDIAARAREASRSAFLASLGFYGKAFDQVQDQFNTVQSQLESRRKKADKLYAELVKRGEKVEKQARRTIDDIDLSRLEFTSIADRRQLEARLGRVRRRFSELRDSVRLNPAA